MFFVFQAEIVRLFLRHGGQLLVRDLREVNHLAVIAEIHVAQLRVAIEPQRLFYETVEMPHQEVGEIKRTRFASA